MNVREFTLIVVFPLVVFALAGYVWVKIFMPWSDDIARRRKALKRKKASAPFSPELMKQIKETREAGDRLMKHVKERAK